LRVVVENPRGRKERGKTAKNTEIFFVRGEE